MSIMLAAAGMAQETTSTFKPSGSPIVTVFTDFRVQSTDGKTNTAFEISRAYLGYAYNFSPYFSAKAVMDVTDKSQLSASSLEYLTNDIMLVCQEIL